MGRREKKTSRRSYAFARVCRPPSPATSRRPRSYRASSARGPPPGPAPGERSPPSSPTPRTGRGGDDGDRVLTPVGRAGLKSESSRLSHQWSGRRRLRSDRNTSDSRKPSGSRCDGAGDWATRRVITRTLEASRAFVSFTRLSLVRVISFERPTTTWSSCGSGEARRNSPACDGPGRRRIGHSP